MLNLLMDREHRNCQGRTRREFLQVAGLGLGGMSLSTLLSLRAQAADAGGAVKDTSVVLLFLTGGVSQIETFDPKMAAPSEFRSVTGEITTSIPGVTFGGTFPRLARSAHKMAVIRSFTHSEADHTRAVQQVARGANPTAAGMGAIAARLRGAHHPNSVLSNHAYLGADEIDPQFLKEKLRLLEAIGPGPFGPAYAPLQIGGDGQLNRSLEPKISPVRLDNRRALRRAFDRLSYEVDSTGVMASLDRFEQQALDLVLGRTPAAFDLSNEDPRTVERYDTSRYMTGIKKHRASTLGKQMLIARRLCESGCGFVTIHNPGWDMHGGPTQYDMTRGMEELGRPVDHAVSTFIEDVEQRGLSEKILLVITGEFGRTPKVNKNGGRDHWPRLSTLAFAGGGLKMGQVVGRSTARAEAPSSIPITIDNLLATVLHTLFDVPSLRLLPSLPRSIGQIIERSEPIAELV